MSEKIINDLMDAAEDMKCNRCPIRDCPNYEASDRKGCLFTLAANAISSLKKENKQLKKNCEAEQLNATCAITELAEFKLRALQFIEANILTMNVSSKWISVEERLPEEGQNVLVSVRRSIGISNIVCHDMVTGEPIWAYTGLGTDPEYWMPLPEPPKEEEK